LATFDKLDKAIIHLLNRDGRLSSSAIARQLQVTERTVRNRIKRLTESGVIRPVAVVNPAAFGYTTMPEVSYVAYAAGDQDISLQAMFKNSSDLHIFITNKLRQVPGIRHTRTVLVPRIIKDAYQWLPPDEAFDA
jgi:Lrp/AsnC family transcriptional regulator for asnA, asnC and gidA